MKKKFFGILLAFAFILAGTVCLTACGGTKKYSVKVEGKLPNNVEAFYVGFSEWSTEKEALTKVRKGEEVCIIVRITYGCRINGLGVFVNGEDISTEMVPTQYVNSNVYYKKFKMTKDITISLWGEPTQVLSVLTFKGPDTENDDWESTADRVKVRIDPYNGHDTPTYTTLRNFPKNNQHFYVYASQKFGIYAYVEDYSDAQIWDYYLRGTYAKPTEDDPDHEETWIPTRNYVIEENTPTETEGVTSTKYGMYFADHYFENITFEPIRIRTTNKIDFDMTDIYSDKDHEVRNIYLNRLGIKTRIGGVEDAGFDVFEGKETVPFTLDFSEIEDVDTKTYLVNNLKLETYAESSEKSTLISLTPTRDPQNFTVSFEVKAPYEYMSIDDHPLYMTHYSFASNLMKLLLDKSYVTGVFESPKISVDGVAQDYSLSPYARVSTYEDVGHQSMGSNENPYNVVYVRSDAGSYSFESFLIPQVDIKRVVFGDKTVNITGDIIGTHKSADEKITINIVENSYNRAYSIQMEVPVEMNNVTEIKVYTA